MEKIVEWETSKFEDCKKEPISFDQESIKTGDCYFKSSPRKCSVRKGVLKKFRNIHKKILVLESLVNKFAGLQA